MTVLLFIVLCSIYNSDLECSAVCHVLERLVLYMHPCSLNNDYLNESLSN